jgi:hypothetical protein
VIEMNADELHLRRRVHHAFDALAPAAPPPARVFERVRARVEARAQRRRWTAAAVGVAAALVVLSLAGVQLVPRGARLPVGSAPPQAGQSFGGFDSLNGSGGTNGGPAATQGAQAALPRNRPAPLMPCAPRDLQVSVSTDQRTYPQGAVVTVSASVTNRGLVACLYPLDPAVWVTDSRGTQWRLCPELATPPPTPMPASTVYEGAINPSVVVNAGGLRPGQSAETSCVWHTAYGNVAPGTYTAHATWDSTSGTATLTITPASPTPRPSPSSTPTATPSPKPLLPLPIP